MATSVVWVIFVVVAALLGFVGYHFSVRTVRWVTGIVALGLALAVTAYGLTRSGPGSSNLESSFAHGADAVGDAFFRPLGLGSPVSGPGRAGWVVIIILLVLGYRALEAWALHWQAPQLDTSKLSDGQPSVKPDGAPADSVDGLTDGQRHDLLAAEVCFRLAAMEVRAPAILPGGSRSAGLATIAEGSGFGGAGLAGAIIRFFGMLWPNPRQVQLRVWVEPSQKGAGPKDAGSKDAGSKAARWAGPTRVTVELDNPRTGETISTQTLAAGDIHEAATKTAGYVARQIFAMDPSTPPWCFGAADGGDLSALLLSRQDRVRVVAPVDMNGSRSAQIGRLKKVALSSRCAGVVRYELAQLFSIQGEPSEDHLTALRLHALNREQFPRFYRGRYRLGMSLEMISDQGFRFTCDKAARDELAEILNVLRRCRLTEKQLCADEKIRQAKVGEGWELTPAVRLELLKAAQQELRGVRRQLTVGRVLWAAFRHRDERAIWRIYYPGLRMRQSFHDGVCVAELLVAARRRATEEALKEEQRKAGKPNEEKSGEKQKRRFRPLRPGHLRLGIRVASAIAGSDSLIETIPANSHPLNSQDPWPPAHASGKPAPKDPRDRVRRLPLLRRTASWQAAYNTACLYAALASERLAAERLAAERGTGQGLSRHESKAWEDRVIVSLERVVYNQYAEMERPYDLIFQDPDFSALKSAQKEFPDFKKFLENQRRMDYPDVDADTSLSWASADLTHRGQPANAARSAATSAGPRPKDAKITSPERSSRRPASAKSRSSRPGSSRRAKLITWSTV
jgi:hypothetical protein